MTAQCLIQAKRCLKRLLCHSNDEAHVVLEAEKLQAYMRQADCHIKRLERRVQTLDKQNSLLKLRKREVIEVSRMSRLPF